MGFLDRLLGRRETQPVREAEPSQEAEPPQPECPHVILVPNWDMAEDMGDLEKVSRYTCEACGAGFSREEGDQLRAKGSGRIRQIGTDTRVREPEEWEQKELEWIERTRRNRGSRND